MIPTTPSLFAGVPARQYAQLSQRPAKMWTALLLVCLVGTMVRAQTPPTSNSNTNTNAIRASSEQIEAMRRALRQAMTNAVAGATNATPTNTTPAQNSTANAIDVSAPRTPTNAVAGAASPTALTNSAAATNVAPSPTPLMSAPTTNRATRPVPQRTPPTSVALPGTTRPGTNT